jgi:hypothetical protein
MRSCPKYQYSRFNASFPIGSARYNAVSHYDDLSGNHRKNEQQSAAHAVAAGQSVS